MCVKDEVVVVVEGSVFDDRCVMEVSMVVKEGEVVEKGEVVEEFVSFIFKGHSGQCVEQVFRIGFIGVGYRYRLKIIVD